MPCCTYIVSSALQKHRPHLFNIVPAETGVFFNPSIHRCFAPLRAADAQFSLGSFLALLNELERLGSPTQLSRCLLTEWRKIPNSCASPFAQEGLGYIKALEMAKPKPLLAGIKNIFVWQDHSRLFRGFLFFWNYFTTFFALLKMLVTSLGCFR